MKRRLSMAVLESYDQRLVIDIPCELSHDSLGLYLSSRDALFQSTEREEYDGKQAGAVYGCDLPLGYFANQCEKAYFPWPTWLEYNGRIGKC